MSHVQYSQRFGPQSAYVEAFISAMRDLTAVEVGEVIAARTLEWDAERYDARDVALFAARDAGRDGVWEGSLVAAWHATVAGGWGDSPGDVWCAGWVPAVQALVVLDLVGWRGLTWEHIDVLVGPCRVVPRLAGVIEAAIADVSGSHS